MSVDGLLVIDKPVGPTSHDVVARVRRILRERRIGHTGTLDPLASGVLLLLIGRATRLAQFFSTDDKRYEATIRLGFATDTYDALGRPASPLYEGPLPSPETIGAALSKFRGTFHQQPPAFSAKKIAGRRSYDIARANQQSPTEGSLAAPTAVSVTVSSLDLIEVQGHAVRVMLTCSSGFYVRSLAHDLGNTLGVGAHLTSLKRLEAGGWTLEESVPLSELEDPSGGTDRAKSALVPLVDVLRRIPTLILSDRGVRRAVTGCDIGAVDLAADNEWRLTQHLPARVRLVDMRKNLVGIGDLTPAGLLHPVVVLM